MRIYFLVEGQRTEHLLYPAWLSYVLPTFHKIEDLEDSQYRDSYYLLSGRGYPSILQRIDEAAETLASIDCQYDYFVVAADSEDVGYSARRQELLERCNSAPFPHRTQVRFIVQNPCIETWLLGNRRIHSHNASCPRLVKCQEFYNPCLDDPEEMRKPDWHNGTVAHFHEFFLRHTILERTKERRTYKKNNPGITKEQSYFEEIVSRQKETGHINSFLDFTMFYNEVLPLIAPPVSV